MEIIAGTALRDCAGGSAAHERSYASHSAGLLLPGLPDRRLRRTGIFIIVQYRIAKLLESALFYKLPAIRFHILTPFLVGKLVVLPPFRGAILPFEKNAEDFRIFFKKFFEQQNTPVRKARTGV